MPLTAHATDMGVYTPFLFIVLAVVYIMPCRAAVGVIKEYLPAEMTADIQTLLKSAESEQPHQKEARLGHEP